MFSLKLSIRSVRSMNAIVVVLDIVIGWYPPLTHVHVVLRDLARATAAHIIRHMTIVPRTTGMIILSSLLSMMTTQRKRCLCERKTS